MDPMTSWVPDTFTQVVRGTTIINDHSLFTPTGGGTAWVNVKLRAPTIDYTVSFPLQEVRAVVHETPQGDTHLVSQAISVLRYFLWKTPAPPFKGTLPFAGIVSNVVWRGE